MAINTGNPLVDGLGGHVWGKNYFFTCYVENAGDFGTRLFHWENYQTQAFDRALQAWAEVADVHFYRADAAHADWTLGKPNFDPSFDKADKLASATREFSTGRVYGNFLNDRLDWDYDHLRPGAATSFVFLHEIGHALGLAHPFEKNSPAGHVDFTPTWPTGTPGLNIPINTVMTEETDETLTEGLPATPMAIDIAAIQSMYGANTTANWMDNTYVISEDAFRCIWDTGGTDTIVYKGFNEATINLNSATLIGPNAGGDLSTAVGVDGGFTIAADITNAIDNIDGETGVIIENAIGGDGNDKITGNNTDNKLEGGAGNDALKGGFGEDTLLGGADDDTLDGGGDADYMNGGTGNDTYYVLDHEDVVSEYILETNPAAYYEAGSSNDTIITSLSNYDLNPQTYSEYGVPLKTSDIIYGVIENLRFEGTGGFTGIGNGVANRIEGGAVGDRLVGNGGEDTLKGFGGNDTLDGGADKDTLDGGAGADRMYGGIGDDTYYVDDIGDVVSEELFQEGPGYRLATGDAESTKDTIVTSLSSYDLSNTWNSWYGPHIPNSKVVYGYVENLTFYGEGNFVGTGNHLANTLHGGAGNDTLSGLGENDVIRGFGGEDDLFGGSENDQLDGGADRDYMNGGYGDDTYYVDHAGDEVDEQIWVEAGPNDIRSLGDAGSTNDTIVTTLSSYDLSHMWNGAYAPQDQKYVYGWVENLTYAGTDGFTGVGNAIKNIIVGGGKKDWLLGNGGADQLLGEGGDDVLIGGSEDDSLVGGQGSDTFAYSGALWEIGSDTIHGGELGARYDGVSLTEIPDAGRDTLNFRQLNAGVSVTVDLSAQRFEATDGFSIVQSREVQGIEDVVGSAGHDTLIGDASKNVLTGGGGEDTIHGGNRDSLIGGGDADTFVIEKIEGLSQHVSAFVTIQDFQDGVDKIDLRQFSGITSIDDLYIGDHDPSTDLSIQTAGAGVGLGGSQSIRLDGIIAAQLDASDFVFFGQPDPGTVTGTDSADTLTGTASANTIYGLADNDTLAGLGGADILDGGAGYDTADYSASGGFGVTVNLATGQGINGDADGDTLIGIEKVIGSSQSDTLTGGDFHGELRGGDGEDWLFGGSVYDLLDGGAGNDNLRGTGGQTSMFGGAGNDTLLGSFNNSNTIYGGIGDDVMYGGDFVDVFYDTEANGGDDFMWGGGGNDVLCDYYGYNRLMGGGGDDWIVSGSTDGGYLDGGEGDDTLYSSLGGNILVGGNGNDRLEAAWGGTNTMTGGQGDDTFYFRLGATVNAVLTVTDFEDGIDQVFIYDTWNLGLTFEQLSITDSEAGAVVSYYDQRMTLTGIAASQLTADDFTYV